MLVDLFQIYTFRIRKMNADKLFLTYTFWQILSILYFMIKYQIFAVNGDMKYSFTYVHLSFKL